MGQITITLNGRSYKLRCGDGEEARLLELAAHVEGRLGQLKAEFGPVGDERLLVMASIMIADELFDTRQALAATQATAAPPSLDHLRPIDSLSEAPTVGALAFEADRAPMDDVPLDLDPIVEADGNQNREAAQARALRRSDSPLSINERLADARESASLRSGERKPG